MKQKPNILFIMADDHSASGVSAYQSPLSSVFQTPNIDRLYTEGCMLRNFCSTNAICTPARASILTGQYGNINGVKSLDDSWDANCDLNLVKIMQENAYETALYGKWHLHCEPLFFDHYKILSTDHGQGRYRDPEFMEQDGTPKRYPGYVTDIITEMVLDFLNNRDTHEKPFFLMCHHKAPHDFWEYPERHEHMFDGVEIPVPESLFEDRSHRSIASRDYGSSVTPRNKIRSLYEDFCQKDYVTGPLLIDDNMSFEDKGYAAYQKYLKDYLRTVAGIDDSVGKIINELESQNILDNTIVVYTSDQGMYLGEHDYQDKRWSFEESIKCPMLIRYPKEIAPQTELPELMANIDIAPTLLDFAGISLSNSLSNQVQGRSCRDMICGKNDAFSRDAVYFRYWMHRAHRHDNPAHFGIRTNKYKLIFYYGLPLDVTGALDEPTPSGWELYDLEKDPYELQNVYNYKDYEKDIIFLKKKLEQCREEFQDTDEQYPELLALYHEKDA